MGTGDLGLGLTVGQVVWQSPYLQSCLVWQAREAWTSARLPGHRPGLTLTLNPAELSKAEAQQQESDEVDEPGTPDSEVGPTHTLGGVHCPRAATAWGEGPHPDHTPTPLRWP